MVWKDQLCPHQTIYACKGQKKCYNFEQYIQVYFPILLSKRKKKVYFPIINPNLFSINK